MVAGLRSLLRQVPGCDTPCFERAEDWFEHAARWGATNVESMVRLGLSDNLVASLALPPKGEEEIGRRLRTVSTTVLGPAPEAAQRVVLHTEL